MSGSHNQLQFQTNLEQLASLNVHRDATVGLLTRIVCTIGPVATKNMIKDLLKAGMTVARLNFSHDSHVEHGQRLRMIREAVKELEKETKQTYAITIALDTKGPEIRTGLVEKGGKVELKTGDQVTLTIDEADRDKCSDKKIYINYRGLPAILSTNEARNVYIDDGKIILKCTKADTTTATCTVSQGGLLGSRKGVALPGAHLQLPAVSEQDLLDLQFGLDHGVDMIFASFIQDASDVQAIRRSLQYRDDILVVAKIETQKALDNIDEIIGASDAIMVARGDLAVHIPITRVFRAQKSIIAKCNLAGKPVICATQMLESMMDGVRPSRSDVSDIANAVYDGADAVMLSGETSVGKHPVKCVEVMAEICRFAEASSWHMRRFEEITRKTLSHSSPLDGTTSAAVACVYQSIVYNASAIIICSVNTFSEFVRSMARCRPNCPVIVICESQEFTRRLALCKGIYQIKLEEHVASIGGDAASTELEDTSARNVQTSIKLAKEKGFVKRNDVILVVSLNNLDRFTVDVRSVS